MLARGPSGVNFPSGFDPRTDYGGMHPSGRFAGVLPDSPSDSNIPTRQHVKMIDQRLDAGQSLRDAVAARAYKFGMDPQNLLKLYDDYKKKYSIEGLTEEQISCRSDEGITVGIVDSIITNLRLFKGRDQSPHEVKEALLDVADDPDFEYFLDALEKAKQKEKN